MFAKLKGGGAEGEQDPGRSHEPDLVGSSGRRRGGGELELALQEEEAAGFSLSLLVSRGDLQLV